MSVSSNELGELLIDLGLIDSQQLVDAISLQQISGHRLTVVLEQMGLVSERQLKDALELQFGVNFVNLSGAPPDEAFVKLIPEDIERKFRFVPIAKSGNQHTVAMVDPDDLNAADMIRLHLGTNNFKKLVCTADDFEHLMKITYEKAAEPAAPEPAPEPAPEVKKATTNGAGKKKPSPKASQTKLKSHMRNLFGADSDDDLDDMFGGESSDNIAAASEAPAAEIASENGDSVSIEPVVDEAPAPKKTSKKKAKSFTSLFDEDDDDEFGEKEPAETETTSAAAAPESLESLTNDEEIELNPVAKIKKTKKSTAKSSDEEPPQNQLLEHILKEADANPKPTKKGKPKKSMASLFGDDDDMDFDDDSSDNESETPEAPSALQEAEPAEAESEPTAVTEESPTALADDDEIESKSGGENGPATTISKNKSFRSLFDDDDDDLGLGGDSDEDSISEVASEAPAEEESQPAEVPEAEVETVPELEPEPELEPQPEPEPESQPEAEMESAPEPDSNGVSEPPVLQAEEPPTSEKKRSIVTKQFRSLFDDEVEEDELFGNEPALNESLTAAPVIPVESPPEPPPVVDAVDEAPVEEIEKSGEYSTAQLLDAIDKPFQSLFDDDDDDEIFGSNETLTAPEDTSETTAEEASEITSESSSATPVVADPEPLVADPSAEQELEFEEVPLAYNSSFDDEMDEDSLFASASHPIPEGAPQLRDLLSRFDDGETGSHAALESVTGSSEPEEQSAPEPVKKDAELAVSALLAALDEQHPDEPVKIEPKVEAKAEPQKPKAEPRPIEPGEQFSADRIIEELESEEAPAMFSKIDEDEVAEPTAEAQPEPEAPPAEPVEAPVAEKPDLTPIVGQLADKLAADFFKAQSAEEPEEEPAAKIAAPKSRRLRALMSDMDDEDEFGDSIEKKIDVDAIAADITSGAELTAEEESTNLRELLTGGKAEFEPVLLDHEVLDDTYGSSTTDLPPVVVSNQQKSLARGEEAPAANAAPPVVEAFDQEIAPAVKEEGPVRVAEPTTHVEPAKRLAPTSLPEESAEVPVISASEPPPSMDDPSMPPLPETAAELPDALEEVLASVTFEMENHDLANLSGNRTEISFLEEIVESELALTEDNWEKDEAAPPAVAAKEAPAQPAAASAAAQPAVAQTVASQPAQTPAVKQPEKELPPQPVVLKPVPDTPVAQPIAAKTETKPVAAETPAVEQNLQPKGVEQLDPSILNLATQILTQAVSSPCSDVHFEPLSDGLALRFMSDGELLDETILPAQIQVMLILCLKSMAGLDTKITDRPQDKKFVTRTFGDPVEMRITSIPGQHGEMIAVSLKT